MNKIFQKHAITNEIAYFDKWEDIKELPQSKITHKAEDDKTMLNGLLIYGYELKFADGTNANGERYTKECFSKFIENYYVAKKLNLPVDVEHDWRPEWKVGRVIYFEVNTTGVYVVAYVPKAHPQYEYIKLLLQEGILQGFSKCGWCVDGEWVWTDNKRDEGYWQINEIELVAMSLVTTPANGVPFEKVNETKNALTFVDNTAQGKKKSLFK